MYTHAGNKMLVASLALAAGGILACAAALLDVVAPAGSPVVFLGMMLLLGLAAVGLVIAFTWGCDRCEDYLHRNSDKLFGTTQHELGVLPSQAEKQACLELDRRRSMHELPSPNSLGAGDRAILRGSEPTKFSRLGSPPLPRWRHGQ